MQRFVLAALLAIWSVGLVNAQEISGQKAQETKAEILKLEHEKVRALERGGSVAADFLALHDADDIAYTGPNGSAVSKAALVAQWRSGIRKVMHMHHYDYHIRIYANGDVAVVTYLGKDTMNDRPYTTTEALIRQHGMWRTIVHDVIYK